MVDESAKQDGAGNNKADGDHENDELLESETQRSQDNPTPETLEEQQDIAHDELAELRAHAASLTLDQILARIAELEANLQKAVEEEDYGTADAIDNEMSVLTSQRDALTGASISDGAPTHAQGDSADS
eukprot:c20399_g3_i2.p1 GENE.c20399_g3_i2~~c20399_g3_i2.p1  ORF type:complete len:129 (-),score=32.36 c20399_g3_i2:76-462(-)